MFILLGMLQVFIDPNLEGLWNATVWNSIESLLVNLPIDDFIYYISALMGGMDPLEALTEAQQMIKNIGI